MAFLGSGVALMVSAHGGDTNLIHACVSNRNGSIYVVDANNLACGSRERALDWNILGPAGPTGPAGPAGPGGFVADLTGANLYGGVRADLRYRNLAGLNLTGANLTGTNIALW